MRHAGVSGQGFHGETGRYPNLTGQTVTGPLRLVPDKQYDTVLTSWMKSHPGFQQGNFPHALARRGLAPPSSVLVPVSAPPSQRRKSGHIADTDGTEISYGFPASDGKLTGGVTGVDLSD